MSVKIIKHGHAFFDKRTCVCPSCKCVFEFMNHDTLFGAGLRISCPECKTMITFDSTNDDPTDDDVMGPDHDGRYIR